MSFEIDEETGVIIKDGEYFGAMGVARPPACPRECSDCEPLASLITNWADTPKDRRFTCIGRNDGSRRVHLGDELRHCFKNDVIDSMEDWDERDVVDTVSVLMQGLSIHGNMKLNEQHQPTDK